MRHLPLVLGLIVASSGLNAQRAIAQTAAPESASRPGAIVNINTATSAQLQTLPGVGERTAERILEYRQKSGGFKKIEELMNVQGIGEKSFLKLKPLVTVGPAKTETASTSTK
jgi:competence protein ComEA